MILIMTFDDEDFEDNPEDNPDFAHIIEQFN